jgi:3-methyladenine DNA glycosylase AlkD
MPTVDAKTVIGVRIPLLRKLAAEVSKMPDIDLFLSELPHTYYEENNLHGFVIERIKSYDGCTAALDAFLPYVDNWATCDLMSPKIFKKNKARLLTDIQRWMAASDDYTIRFGIRMLMNHYLDEDFRTEYLEWVASIHSESYYVRMMAAWYFATALAKQWDSVISYLVERKLDIWVHNKTIQKACESLRIEDDQKRYLKALKMKC